MEKRTVEHLKALRSELVERRRAEAYLVAGRYRDRIAILVKVHLAIQALDAVIEEGGDGPDSDAPAFIESQLL